MNPVTPLILIVDDDIEICQELKTYLTPRGFRISLAHDGKAMWRQLKTKNPNLILLDIMLPGADGISLCQELRTKSAIPIIMLSAAGEESDRIAGLEVGADDYLPKPFNARELLARIKALLRRSQGTLGERRQKLTKLPNISFLDWQLNQNRRLLIAPDGVAVPLSHGEYHLLLAFLEHPQRTLSRDQLLDMTQGRETGPFDRSIDVQVGRLRKKIETNPKEPTLIITVRGGGYQFTPEVNFEK